MNRNDDGCRCRDLASSTSSVLNDWIVAQRWFASKTREVPHIEIVDAVPLATSRRSWSCA